MIRLTLLYVFIVVLMATALRRWYVSLCGLLFLTVVMQHPSMPHEIYGIQGLNPWNVTFAVILIGWLIHRRNDPPRARTSTLVWVLFGLYVATVLVAGMAAVVDIKSLRGEFAQTMSRQDVFLDGIVNPLKYVLVGALFFDGATTRRRVRWALFSAVTSGLCYSILMFKSLKLRVFTMDYVTARRVTDKLIGLFANDLAELLAFAIWAAIILVLVLDKRWQRALWLGLTALALPAFIALESRSGFLAVTMVGLVLGAAKWRRMLILFPVAILVILAMVPSVSDRILSGVAPSHEDWNEISSGRTTYIWPPVIDQIWKSPLYGHGRFGILRTDCHDVILAASHSVPRHPHCSYLEILLDAGLIGLLICLCCMGGLARSAWPLLRMRHDPLLTALGAVAIIGIVTELSAGATGSSFYASQSAVPYLCVWGVMLRVATERAALRRSSRVPSERHRSMARRHSPVRRPNAGVLTPC